MLSAGTVMWTMGLMCSWTSIGCGRTGLDMTSSGVTPVSARAARALVWNCAQVRVSPCGAAFGGGCCESLGDALRDRRRGEEVHPSHTVGGGFDLDATVGLGADRAGGDGLGMEPLAQDPGTRAEAGGRRALGDDEHLLEEHRPPGGRDVAVLVGDHLRVPRRDAPGLK
nr:MULTISPECIES: hypothetical protein [unclassified Plantibacter]